MMQNAHSRQCNNPMTNAQQRSTMLHLSRRIRRALLYLWLGRLLLLLIVHRGSGSGVCRTVHPDNWVPTNSCCGTIPAVLTRSREAKRKSEHLGQGDWTGKVDWRGRHRGEG